MGDQNEEKKIIDYLLKKYSDLKDCLIYNGSRFNLMKKKKIFELLDDEDKDKYNDWKDLRDERIKKTTYLKVQKENNNKMENTNDLELENFKYDNIVYTAEFPCNVLYNEEHIGYLDWNNELDIFKIESFFMKKKNKNKLNKFKKKEQ